MSLFQNPIHVKDFLLNLGCVIQQTVTESLQKQSIEERSAVYSEGDDDTIFRIDHDIEEIILPILEQQADSIGGVVLIAEGISDNEVCCFPSTIDEHNAAVRIIMDPIDGTRGIMYDKRSAFFLAGAAVNHGKQGYLQDIEVAVMVELPTSRSYVSDQLWAIRGQGTHRITRNLLRGEEYSTAITPSKSKTILGGFGQISRFFPPGREILAKIEEELIETILPDAPQGKALLFNDQYISTGGQFYELLLGHDRFCADLRGILYQFRKKNGQSVGLTCHPYDMCAQLICAEAGIIITDPYGNPLDAPMDTTSAVDWIGYANHEIQTEVEPVLQRLLRRYNLIS